MHPSHLSVFTRVSQVILTMLDGGLQMSQYALLISEMMIIDLQGQNAYP